VRVGRRALGHPAWVAIAVGAFLALALFRVAFPIVIGIAAVLGWALGRYAPRTRHPAAHGDAPDGPAPVISDDGLPGEPPCVRRTVRVPGAGLVLWSAPLGGV